MKEKRRNEEEELTYSYANLKKIAPISLIVEEEVEEEVSQLFTNLKKIATI